MNIEVMGTGCPKCKKLFERTQEAVKTLGLDATVNYVTDVEKIIAMGFIQSPILMVNGKAVMVGQLPSTDEITTLLKQAI
jgi:small redox-active disulfide protein 2